MPTGSSSWKSRSVITMLLVILIYKDHTSVTVLSAGAALSFGLDLPDIIKMDLDEVESRVVRGA